MQKVIDRITIFPSIQEVKLMFNLTFGGHIPHYDLSYNMYGLCFIDDPSCSAVIGKPNLSSNRTFPSSF